MGTMRGGGKKKKKEKIPHSRGRPGREDWSSRSGWKPFLRQSAAAFPGGQFATKKWSPGVRGGVKLAMTYLIEGGEMHMFLSLIRKFVQPWRGGS